MPYRQKYPHISNIRFVWQFHFNTKMCVCKGKEKKYSLPCKLRSENLSFTYNRARKKALSIFGALGGALFSMLMDVWTTLSIDGEFLLSRYLVNVVSSLSFMAIYAVSNIVFLLLLAHPFIDKLERIKTKYGIFQ